MSRYEPLNQFLAAQSASETQLTFKEVERILHRSLPKSARKHSAWWANTRTHSHAGAWMDAGWKTERVELGNERVAFVRASGASPPAPKIGPPTHNEILPIPVQTLSGAGLQLVDRYANAHACSRAEAIVEIINAEGLKDRMAMLERFSRRWTGEPGSNSVDLIREDRDAR